MNETLEGKTPFELLVLYQNNSNLRDVISEHLKLEGCYSLNGRLFFKTSRSTHTQDRDIPLYVSQLLGVLSPLGTYGAQNVLRDFFLDVVLQREEQCLRVLQEHPDLLVNNFQRAVTSNLFWVMYHMAEDRVLRASIEALSKSENTLVACFESLVEQLWRQGSDRPNSRLTLFFDKIDPQRLGATYQHYFINQRIHNSSNKHARIELLEFLVAYKVPVPSEYIVQHVQTRQMFIELVNTFNNHYVLEDYLPALLSIGPIGDSRQALMECLGKDFLSHVHPSLIINGLACSPQFSALLQESPYDQVLTPELPIDALMVKTEKIDEHYTGVHQETLLHLMVRKPGKNPFAAIAHLLQCTGTALIDQQDSDGNTPLQVYVSNNSEVDLDPEIMTALIESHPDLQLANHGDVSVWQTVAARAPNYLAKLLYHGQGAYEMVAVQFKMAILACEGRFSEEDTTFLATIRGCHDAKKIFEYGGEFFLQGQKSALVTALQASIKALPAEKQALFNVTYVATASWHKNFSDPFNAQYLSAWCQAWVGHRPEHQALFVPRSGMPTGVYQLMMAYFRVDEMQAFRLVSKEVKRIADACLFPFVIYQTLHNRYLDCPEKQAMETVADATPQQKIMAFLLAVRDLDPFSEQGSGLASANRSFRYFVDIVLNRPFRFDSEQMYVGGALRRNYMHSDVLLVAALLVRKWHFTVLLEKNPQRLDAFNGFFNDQVYEGGLDLKSNRLVFHLADRGMIQYLEALQDFEAAQESQTPLINWAGEPVCVEKVRGAEFHMVVKLLSSSGDPEVDLNHYRCLNGESLSVVEEPTYYTKEANVMRALRCSPIMASLQRGHRGVARFLAQRESVTPTIEMIQLAQRKGFHQVVQALIDRVPTDSPIRPWLVQNRLLEANSQRENFELIANHIDQLIGCLLAAKSAHVRSRRTLGRSILLRRQGTHHEAEALYSLLDVMIDGGDVVQQVQSVCDLLTHEALCVDKVPGSGLLRYIIDEIHNNQALVTVINLWLFPDQQARHSELFNDTPYTISVSMPPREMAQEKEGDKFSLQYRAFYAKYLIATLQVWLEFVNEHRDEFRRGF